MWLCNNFSPAIYSKRDRIFIWSELVFLVLSPKFLQLKSIYLQLCVTLLFVTLFNHEKENDLSVCRKLYFTWKDCEHEDHSSLHKRLGDFIVAKVCSKTTEMVNSVTRQRLFFLFLNSGDQVHSYCGQTQCVCNVVVCRPLQTFPHIPGHSLVFPTGFFMKQFRSDL